MHSPSLPQTVSATVKGYPGVLAWPLVVGALLMGAGLFAVLFSANRVQANNRETAMQWAVSRGRAGGRGQRTGVDLQASRPGASAAEHAAVPKRTAADVWVTAIALTQKS